MRAAANELQPRLKQTLVIENQGGAAGILGGQSCARAAGDGGQKNERCCQGRAHGISARAAVCPAHGCARRDDRNR